MAGHQTFVRGFTQALPTSNITPTPYFHAPIR